METKSKNAAKFYNHSRDYWAKQPATVNGMLGGYDFVSECDLKQSQELIDWLFTVRGFLLQYFDLIFYSIFKE
jgi:hypothetical protein